MAANKPGNLCATNAEPIDDGTHCLFRSPSPGPSVLYTFFEDKFLIGVGLVEKNLRLSISAIMPKTLSALDFEDAARSLGSHIDVNLLHAFSTVESGGKSGFGPTGLPIIAYEGHIFRKYTHKKYDKDYPLLSYHYVKKAGTEWKKNNKDQVTAWNTLNAAIALDEIAALKSCSWGMFQLMGFNYESCGYKDVKGFVAAMKASERGQLDAFVGFCKKRRGMVDAMRNKDFATMAMLYNGKDYGDYDQRIRKAYKKLIHKS